jgi:hypothetical protein
MKKLIIFCIYRAPAGNLKQFYDSLENILNHFLQQNVTYLICGDLNINYFIKSNDTLKLETLMNMFNLTQVIDFPTTVINNNGTLIDTIFVDIMIYDKIQVKPFVNGLSDHKVQIVHLQNANTGFQQSDYKKKIRLINEQTIKYFQTLLKDVTWETVYKTTSVNEMYNRFQRIFLRHYEASFPVSYTAPRGAWLLLEPFYALHISGGLGYCSNLFTHYIFLTALLRTYSSMKMERTESSKTLAFKLQTPGNNPKENSQHSKHGESLKSRTLKTLQMHLINSIHR